MFRQFNEIFFKKYLLDIRLVEHRTRAIISRGLYVFYPIYEDHFFVLKDVFPENCMVSIQERFVLKSGL